MIFPNDIARAILTGHVTQARIPTRGADHCPHKVGRTYAITRQATAKEREEHGGKYRTVGRLRVTDIRLQELGDAEWEHDVARESLDFDDWIAYWERKGGRDFGALRHYPTWVIRFELDQDRPKLLAADSSRGYTHDPRLALTGEPEAVDDDYQTELCKAALERDKARMDAQAQRDKRDRELLTIEERMRRARQEARLRQIDVSSESFLLKRTMQQGRSEGSVIHRLVLLERRVYRNAA